ncbi:hypothetical protein HU200_036402 [Digitaria exilis]|uniref:Uncharacterized protein n=1 Tax=Digitaria exilis TaxID=1010633 RepID=A0A835BS37_9POAL|nr:hypothetical protein HU200_050187 [Digitaria exilis]KAF8696769.1 hypothetical protein HU200_036402 [Digitaria exilis]
MLGLNAYVLLFTAFFFSGFMQLSMAHEKPAAAAMVRVDASAIDQAVAYLLMFAALFVTYFSH